MKTFLPVLIASISFFSIAACGVESIGSAQAVDEAALTAGTGVPSGLVVFSTHHTFASTRGGVQTTIAYTTRNGASGTLQYTVSPEQDVVALTVGGSSAFRLTFKGSTTIGFESDGPSVKPSTVKLEHIEFVLPQLMERAKEEGLMLTFPSRSSASDECTVADQDTAYQN